jgi:hypothetical protein
MNEYNTHVNEIAENMMRQFRNTIRQSADILHEPARSDLMQKLSEKMALDSDFVDLMKKIN